MLNRKNKLKKDNDFKAVFDKGKYCQAGFLSMKFLKNELAMNRFAFLVGSKVSKKAVIRNRIKRRLEESTRLMSDQLKQGFDIVVMVKPEIVDRTHEEMEENLVSLFKIAQIQK